jgi:hypothetical protein
MHSELIVSTAMDKELRNVPHIAILKSEGRARTSDQSNAMHLNRMKCTVHIVSSGGGSGEGGGGGGGGSSGGGPAAAAAAGPLPLHAYCRPPPSPPASAPAACGPLPPESQKSEFILEVRTISNYKVRESVCFKRARVVLFFQMSPVYMKALPSKLRGLRLLRLLYIIQIHLNIIFCGIKELAKM